MRFFQGLLSPIKGIYNVVLITDMPRVLPGPPAELNAADEKSENEKSRENAEAYFTTPRRNYCTAPKRLCDHSPKMKRRTPIRQFLTVCVRNCVSSNRPSSQRQPCKKERTAKSNRGFDYRVTAWTTVCTALLVPLTALCATFFAVIAVLFATFLAVRTGPAWALWTLPMQSPNARNTENNAFMVPKVS